MLDWIQDRFAERTSLDGVALIAVGVVVLIFSPLATIVSYAAILYGIWTLVKSE